MKSMKNIEDVKVLRKEYKSLAVAILECLAVLALAWWVVLWMLGL